MSFINIQNKINNLILNNKNNINDIFKLKKSDYIVNDDNFFRNLNIVSIDTTPILYDLYKFLGTTYSVGGESPLPTSAYDEELISGTTYAYTFIYPIYGFQVPSGDTPEEYTDGATPWEFQTTIAIIKKIINFPLMPNWGIEGSKIISYLTKEDGSIVQDLKFIMRAEGQNTPEISVDFGEFYRWIKLEEGYNLEYYAIYPVPENQQISLNSNIYIFNPKNYYNVQSTKI